MYYYFMLWIIGDGLPDEDFELEVDKQLDKYGKETEYCLCEILDDDFVMAKVISSGKSVDESRESLITPGILPDGKDVCCITWCFMLAFCRVTIMG